DPLRARRDTDAEARRFADGTGIVVGLALLDDFASKEPAVMREQAPTDRGHDGADRNRGQRVDSDPLPGVAAVIRIAEREGSERGEPGHGKARPGDSEDEPRRRGTGIGLRDVEDHRSPDIAALRADRLSVGPDQAK